MSRSWRIEFDGALYHELSRWNEQLYSNALNCYINTDYVRNVNYIMNGYI
jgi:hypothetical protein